MKSFLVIFILICASVPAWSQADNIKRDLKLLDGPGDSVGGAGNGGGGLAINISQTVNRIAMHMGLKDIRGFSKSYRLLIGDYNFCGQNIKNCDTSVQFFSSHRALLIDKKTWVKLTNDEKLMNLEMMVREIDNAR